MDAASKGASETAAEQSQRRTGFPLSPRPALPIGSPPLEEANPAATWRSGAPHPQRGLFPRHCSPMSGAHCPRPDARRPRPMRRRITQQSVDPTPWRSNTRASSYPFPVDPTEPRTIPTHHLESRATGGDAAELPHRAGAIGRQPPPVEKVSYERRGARPRKTRARPTRRMLQNQTDP